ncbi:transposase [Allorhizocola rhizosphaerae]|uniref:transposase n=1 Tax=Allorhizocola rhizosphaerae TaxID=1872709 RepID=UPI0013C3032D|nr:transposase [Allorhizocola rhizosphaerae]
MVGLNRSTWGYYRRLRDLGKTIDQQLQQHTLAKTIISLPGFGTILSAELLVYTNGMREYTSAAKLAGHAGLAPVRRDSGHIVDNLHRPQRYHRELRRVFWQSTLTAIRICPTSRTFYNRKKTEGKRHTQAVLALARRRVDVLWALIRDNTIYQAR